MIENDSVESGQCTQPNGNLRINPAATIHSKRSINIEQISQSLISIAADVICRPKQRISHEIEIISDLESFLKEHELNLDVIPMGSSSYGFGGAKTDLNICLFMKDGKCSFSLPDSYRICSYDFI